MFILAISKGWHLADHNHWVRDLSNLCKLIFSAEKYEKKILELNNDKKELKKQIDNLQITVEAAARLEDEYDKVEKDNKQLKKDILVSMLQL